MGIFRALKPFLRHELHETIMNIIYEKVLNASARKVVNGIQVFHDMHMLRSALKKISMNTIQKCWIKRGFVAEQESIVQEGGIEDEEELLEDHLIEPELNILKKRLTVRLTLIPLLKLLKS